MRRLTEIQDLILKYIVKKRNTMGFPPSIREIQRAFGFASNNSVRWHLKVLARKKAIKVYPRVFRGIQVLREEF